MKCLIAQKHTLVLSITPLHCKKTVQVAIGRVKNVCIFLTKTSHKLNPILFIIIKIRDVCKNRSESFMIFIKMQRFRMHIRRYVENTYNHYEDYNVVVHLYMTGVGASSNRQY